MHKKERHSQAAALSYVTPYKARALLLVGLTLVTALIELVPPYIAKHIIDDVLRDGDLGLLYLYVGLLFGLAVIRWIGNVVRRWLNTWVGFRAMADLRADLFKFYAVSPTAFLRQAQSRFSDIAHEQRLRSG